MLPAKILRKQCPISESASPVAGAAGSEKICAKFPKESVACLFLVCPKVPLIHVPFASFFNLSLGACFARDVSPLDGSLEKRPTTGSLTSSKLRTAIVAKINPKWRTKWISLYCEVCFVVNVYKEKSSRKQDFCLSLNCQNSAELKFHVIAQKHYFFFFLSCSTIFLQLPLACNWYG